MKRTFTSILLGLIFSVTATPQDIIKQFNAFFKAVPGEKIYLNTDRTFYSPGESIYFSAFVVDANKHLPSLTSKILYVLLLDGTNKVVQRKKLQLINGRASQNFYLYNEVGGIYTLKAFTAWGGNFGEEATFSKEITVEHFLYPTLLLKAEKNKKTYSAGDTVLIDFSAMDLEQKPLANTTLKTDFLVEGKLIYSLEFKTDETGKAAMKFWVPDSMKIESAAVNIKVNYRGVDESISKEIPLNFDFADVQFFPESGHLVANSVNTIAFLAKNKYSKALDVEGYVSDESNVPILFFKSFHMGMGSFNFIPTAGKKYYAHLSKPFKTVVPFVLPEMDSVSLTMHLDSSKNNNMFLTLNSAEKQTIHVYGRVGEDIHFFGDYPLKKGTNAIRIQTQKYKSGIMQLTAFDESYVPLAERLAFINPDKKLKITIQTDKQIYSTRSIVKAKIKVTDENNNPLEGSFVLNVSDNNNLTFANDKQDNLLSYLLLGSELSEKVEEPNFYTNPKEPKALAAIDLLLLTHGWRKPPLKSILEMDTHKMACLIRCNPDQLLISGKLSWNGNRQNFSGKRVRISGHGDTALCDREGNFIFKLNNTKFPVTIYARHRSWNVEQTIMHPLFSEDPLALKTFNQKQYSKNENSFLDYVKYVLNTRNIKPIPLPDYEKFEVGSFSKSIIKSCRIVTAKTTIIDRASNTKTISSSDLAKMGVRSIGTIVSMQAGVTSTTQGISFRGSRADGVAYYIDGIRVLEPFSYITAATGSMGYYYGNFSGYSTGYASNPLEMEILNYYNALDQSRALFTINHYNNTKQRSRTDFRKTLYWNGNLETDKNGVANIEFYTADEITGYRINIEGISTTGLCGMGDTTFSVNLPFTISAKIPHSLTVGDKAKIQIVLTNNTDDMIIGTLSARINGFLVREHDIVKLNQKSFINLEMPLTFRYLANQTVEISFETTEEKDVVTKVIKVNPKGFPVEHVFSGQATQGKFSFEYGNPIAESVKAQFKFYVNPENDFLAATANMIRMPYGCFEQVSSSNYPNILALKLLNKTGGQNLEANKEKALSYLKEGYTKLKNYETAWGGFEWYGNTPPNEALTAYGLLQFHEMQDFPEIGVSQELIDRTVNWLMSRKDGNGGFLNAVGKYGFSNIDVKANNAYITWALSETGFTSLDPQIKRIQRDLKHDFDFYQMALLANVAVNLHMDELASECFEAMREDMKKNGKDRLTTKGTIVHSIGNAANIECLSLFATALIHHEKKITTEISEIVSWLLGKRSIYGFGNTQSPVMAYTALYEYYNLLQYSASSGSLALYVNDTFYAEAQISDQSYVCTISIDPKVLIKGTNVITWSTKGSVAQKPWEFRANWLTLEKENVVSDEIAFNATLNKDTFALSDLGSLHVSITNLKTEQRGQTVAIVHIPAGFNLVPEQIKEMRDKKSFDHYELLDQKLVLYFLGMHSAETKNLYFNLKANIAGDYEAEPSMAFIYYQNEIEQWTKPIRAVILASITN